MSNLSKNMVMATIERHKGYIYDTAAEYLRKEIKVDEDIEKMEVDRHETRNT